MVPRLIQRQLFQRGREHKLLSVCRNGHGKRLAVRFEKGAHERILPRLGRVARHQQADARILQPKDCGGVVRVRIALLREGREEQEIPEGLLPLRKGVRIRLRGAQLRAALLCRGEEVRIGVAVLAAALRKVRARKKDRLRAETGEHVRKPRGMVGVGMRQQNIVEGFDAERETIAEHRRAGGEAAVAAVDHHRLPVGELHDRTVSLPHVHKVNAHLALAARRDLRHVRERRRIPQREYAAVRNDGDDHEQRQRETDEGARLPEKRAQRLPAFLSCGGHAQQGSANFFSRRRSKISGMRSFAHA